MSETQDEHENESESEQEGAGLPDADDLSDSEKDEIEEIREERLAPDNRPDGAEIDNTGRDFDPEAGRFTDDPDHSEDEQPYSSDDQA